MMELHRAYLSELTNLMGWSSPTKDIIIESLNLCNRHSVYSSILSYTTSSRLLDVIIDNKSIKALLISENDKEVIEMREFLHDREIILIPVDNPELNFYDLHNKLYCNTKFYKDKATLPIIGQNCNIHPSVIIENNVEIGDNVKIGPNSVIREGCVIDDNVTIGCCTVIGSEGFQAIRGYDRMIKHVGGVHIYHDVYIGDNTTIGNALFEGTTEIGAYCKISNHVQISHNCKCGQRCVITASCMLMGSSTLMDNVWLAPNAIILNGITVERNAFVGTLSYVNRDVEEGVIVVGIPAKKIEK